MDIRHLLRQNVTIEPYVGPDGDGKATFGAARTVAARVQQSNKQLLDDKGNMVVSSSQVYVDGAVAIAAADRVTLPDGVQPRILSVKVNANLVGSPVFKVIYT